MQSQVAATANNSNCAVGIAYEAGIGGVRMLDGDVTDAVEARSLGLNNQHIDIYSARYYVYLIVKNHQLNPELNKAFYVDRIISK